jgi:YD repeat-containing protein
MVTQAVMKPDEVVKGHHERKVAHKLVNGHVLRVIYDENDFVTVVTVYIARRERYAAKKFREG